MGDQGLSRYVEAQNDVYDSVVRELSAGRKTSHWMWFIFPQIVGLGSSAMAHLYAIRSREEAQTYFGHQILGPRLVECTRLVVEAPHISITDLLGSPDDMKFRSSMTLFYEVSGRKLFGEAIAKFYSEGFDQRTLSILEAMR